MAVIMASYVSFKAVIFFSIYIFGIWFYSHKLKKLPFVGNLTSVISMRELTKDLENIKGDISQNYVTIPVAYGEKTSKVMLTVLAALTLIPTYLLLFNFQVGHMYIFFYFSLFLLVVFLLLLWRSKTKIQYLILHNILKCIILAGVFSILLIDISVILIDISVILNRI